MTTQNTNSFRPGVENLEERSLLSAAPATAFIQNGFLQIDAQAPNAHILVRREGNTVNVYDAFESLGRLQNATGRIASVDISLLNNVAVYAKGGGDIIDVKLGDFWDKYDSRVTTTIKVGDGNNQLWGNMWGSNFLMAGDGNNELHGGNAGDVMYAGDGNNVLVGTGTTDKSFHLGRGNNKVYGGSNGLDTYFLSYGGKAQITFGSGQNKVIVPDSGPAQVTSCTIVPMVVTSQMNDGSYLFDCTQTKVVCPAISAQVLAAALSSGAGFVSSTGATSLTGPGVGIIGNNGAGLVSSGAAGNIIGNNGGGITVQTQNGAAIISNNGGRIVSSNGAGILGQGSTSVLPTGTSPSTPVPPKKKPTTPPKPSPSTPSDQDLQNAFGM